MSKVETSCKECVFAIYKDITQIGCDACMISRFKKAGKEIVEAYDEEKEFYVLRDTHCMSYRPKIWKYADSSLFKRLLKVKKEQTIQYQAIVFVGDNMEDVATTVSSLMHQTIMPKHLTLIKTLDSTLDTRQLIGFATEESKVPWRVETITNKETPPGSMIDFVISVKPFPYYAVFNAGCDIPLTAFGTLNYKIVEELYPLTILEPNSKDDGLIVSLSLHTVLQGNQDIGILEKVKQSLADAENKQAVDKVTDICPEFPK